MGVEVIDPEGLHVPQAYAQVTVGTGTRIAYVAGQVGRDASGALAGPGHADQAEQAMLNVATAVAGAGGTVADIAKLTVFAVGLDGPATGAVAEGLGRALARIGGPPERRAVSLIGVSSLAGEGLLVEIEAVAHLA